MNGDASGDLGFGSSLNLSRLSANAAVAAAAAASLSNNSVTTASLASSNNGNNGNNVSETTSGLDLLQRLTTLIECTENAMDLNNMSAAEVAPPKRHIYSGNYSCNAFIFVFTTWFSLKLFLVDNQLSMNELFGFTNGNNGNQVASQPDDVIALLHQHHLNQVLQQQQNQLQQNQLQQNQLKYGSSAYLGKVCFTTQLFLFH